MIEIEGEILRTEREWERRHRHVLKSQRDKGVEREWCIKPPNKYAYATWYRESQTKPWNKREREAERRARAAERARKHDEQVAEQARKEAEADLLQRICGVKVSGCSHTAWQWVDAGFVPIAEARWRRGNPRGGQSGDFYYCKPYDVRHDPERAAELLKTGPLECNFLPDGRPYNGRPWW